MADTTTPEGNSLAPDEGIALPRIKLGETGFSALKTRAGRMQEEANQQFRYPNMLRVVAEMEASPPVAIGLNALNTLMNRAEITVEPVVGETPQDKQRKDFLLSVLHDMTDSWQTTMQHISTVKQYGHQVSEMVFRRRLTKNGSKYNDGLVGLAGLKHRPQNSIARWNFSDDGRTLISVSQSIYNLENSYLYMNLTDNNGFIEIPREKFILFRCDAVSDNPEGTSILKPCYLAYKQLSLLTDHLMTGVSKMSNGVPFAQLPPQYLNPEANDSDKAVYTSVKNILDSLAKGTAYNIIFPKMMDESGNDLFNLEMLDQKISQTYDVESIIRMFQANILSVLSSDSIAMGDAGGSLSLQDGSTNLLALSVSYRLSEIANELNQTLTPLLWKLNGWSTDRIPKICFKDVSKVSLEQHSKWLQRVASVGLLEVDRGVLNTIRDIGGFDPKPDDEPVDIANLSTTLAGKSSSSGQGMAVGTGNVNGGTSKSSVGGKDSSAQNNDNKG